MEGIKMEFGERLKDLRAGRHISQVKLAEDIGVSKSLIGMYENGKRQPSKQILETLGDYFNVSIDYLTGREDASVYYLDPETAEMAQYMKDRPEMKILFKAAKDATPDDLMKAARIVDLLKGEDDG